MRTFPFCCSFVLVDLVVLVFFGEQLEVTESARDKLQGCADEVKRLAAELQDREVFAPLMATPAVQAESFVLTTESLDKLL